jgi:hypothetical protein
LRSGTPPALRCCTRVNGFESSTCAKRVSVGSEPTLAPPSHKKYHHAHCSRRTLYKRTCFCVSQQKTYHSLALPYWKAYILLLGRIRMGEFNGPQTTHQVLSGWLTCRHRERSSLPPCILKLGSSNCMGHTECLKILYQTPLVLLQQKLATALLLSSSILSPFLSGFLALSLFSPAHVQPTGFSTC